MKTKNGKRLLSVMLVLAMVVASFASGSLMKQTGSEVLAAETTEAEPVYNADEDTLYEVTGVTGILGDATTATLSDGTVTIPSNDRASFVSSLDTTGGYYMSMKLQSSGEQVTVMTRRNGNVGSAQLIFLTGGAQVNHKVNGTDKNISEYFAYPKNKLTEGIQVTLYSEQNSLKVWMDGTLVVNLSTIEGDTQPAQAAPEIYYAPGGATASNIQIWTKGDKLPTYDLATDTLYPIQSVTGGTYDSTTGVITSTSQNNETVFVNTTVSYDAEYYYNVTLKSANNLHLQSRADGPYVEFTTNGCQLFYDNETQITEQVTDSTIFSKMNSDSGLNVTVHSATDRIKVWADGKLVIDESVVDVGKAQPAITWNYETATASNFQIWANGQKQDNTQSKSEPVYNEGDTLLSKVESIENAKSTTDSFAQAGMIATDETYYVSFILRTNTQVDFEYRPKTSSGDWSSSSSRDKITFYGNKNEYKIQSVNDYVVNESLDFENTGVKVTICSEPNRTSIWLNGTQVADSVKNLNDSAQGFPRIANVEKLADESQKAAFTDIKVWKKGTVIPQYDAKVDTKLNTETSYTLSASNYNKNFGMLIQPTDTYYVSYTLKASCQVDFEYRNMTNSSSYIMDGFRDKITFFNDGYMIAGESKVTKTAGWLSEGAKVVICSTPTKVSIWVNGEALASEKTQRNANVYGYPRVAWVSGDAILSDICVWTKNASFTGATATLDGTIGFNFFANISDSLSAEDKAATKVRFTLPDGTIQDVTYGKAVSSDNGYKFTCNVAAKEMTDSISAELYCGTTKIDEVTYSVKEYANTLINDSSQTDATKKLATAMLTYGAKAQQYFNYQADSLASAGITESDLTNITESNFTKATVTQNTSIMTMTSSSLILEGKTTLKIYFELADGVKLRDLKITSESGHVWKLGQHPTNGYFIAIENIAADKLNETIKLSITTGSETTAATFEGNALSYGYAVLKNSSKDTLQNLVKALYQYNQCATAYSVQ